MMNKMMNSMLIAALVVTMVVVAWEFKWYIVAVMISYVMVVYPSRYIKGVRK